MTTYPFLEQEGDNSSGAIRFGLDVLGLSDFRNYGHAAVELVAGFNVISGPNAQGKTNLLEAIYLLSTTRLLRGQRDAEAVRSGCATARAEGRLLGSTTTISVDLAAGVRKRAALNGLKLPRAADLIGRLPSVCVSTLDMEIVRGEPTERRLFLDLELCALYPAYLRHLTHYKRALDQRNALLKDSREWMRPPEDFEVWEQQLAEHGWELREHRRTYLSELAPFLGESHAYVGAGETLTALYEQRDEATSRESSTELLERSRSGDVGRGSTSIGPHRDEIAVQIDSREARLYGSQGQQRTAVIALKMATLEVARQELGATPILLLDDIFSDLDSHRREHLVKWVMERAGQAVLTCTEASAVGPEILKRAKVFEVKAGEIREA